MTVTSTTLITMQRTLSSACKRMAGLARRFSADRAGAVVLLFGLTLIPIMGFVGGAIDYANAYRMQSKLQNALDAASLAAGRELDSGSGSAAVRNSGMRVLKANLGSDFPAGYTAKFDINGKVVTGSATLDVDTYILGVLGIDIFPVGATSVVNISGGTIEVALVLDNSGSMKGAPISALKTAAKKLTQMLYGVQRTSSSVSMAVVPFSATVNVGRQYANAGWMDTVGQSPVHYENFDSKSYTRFALFNAIRNVSWGGCVEARPSPHDVMDTPSKKSSAITRFVPHFYPDEPDRGRGFQNNYLYDKGGRCSRWIRYRSQTAAQNSTCKYLNATIRNPSRYGPNRLCNARPVTPLSNNQGRIISAISAMQAEGSTNITEGVMWGWRLLSPGEPFTQGRSYRETSNRKFMIVMSDGANFYYGQRNFNKSMYAAYGFSKAGRLRSPTSSDSQLEAAMNIKTKASCTNVKAQNITVYTIAFKLNDPTTLALLRNCASGNARAFNIKNSSGLIAAFEAIAKEINRLRITS